MAVINRHSQVASTTLLYWLLCFLPLIGREHGVKANYNPDLEHRNYINPFRQLSQLFMMTGAKDTHFRVIQKFGTDYSPANITQYVSERTGMHCVVVEQKGPKVQGYFTLATEIFDDSGSPHTLEHLIFMGSKSYQYKGLLDKLANRAYSNTNAWTATDHTAYTLDTAGWEGFAQILPVYLEHIILPTLTDEGCYTEVHHIDGEGNDAGVVYSEMQGVENTGSEIMDIKARHLLYPKDVGFRYETGGLMGALRVLTPERIRAFHKEMYQPKNLCLVLVGEVDQDNLLDILDNFEDGIVSDVPLVDAPFRRPWIESPQAPALNKSVLEVVEFPDEDETSGDVVVGMFGPNCNDPVLTGALNVLLAYLCGSSVSILENIMVEKEELASSITYSWDARPNTVIWFAPTGVATERLEYVEKRLFELLKEVASKPLDMGYLKDCLLREKRQLKSQAESSSEYYATAVIHDFLFGARDGSDLKDLSTIKEFDELETWSESQWIEFLKKWISDAPHVSVLGKPSKKLADSLKANEKARIAARKAELGPKGLAAKAEKLKQAIAKNDEPIPKSVLQQFAVPGVDSIHFIESTTARSGLARSIGTESNNIQKLIDISDSGMPLFVQYEHVPSSFVHIVLLFSTSQVKTEHRPLLSIFIDNFFNTPAVVDGKRLEFESIVTALEKDTVSYGMSGGGRYGDPEGLAIQFQVEPDKYAAAIKWIRTMMLDSIFDETRLNAGMSKILADIPYSKRSGSSMMYAVDAIIHFDKESSFKARTAPVKAVFVKRLKKLLAKDSKSVIASFEHLRKSLFTLNNMRALVIGNIETLPTPVDAWKPLASGLDSKQPLLPIVKQIDRLSADGKNPGSYGAVFIPMTAIDSSFLVAKARGLTSYTDPLLPALMVAISFLEAVEGPLWTAIRGTGLAYGASFGKDVDAGFVSFSVYRSPDAYRAFFAGKKIIEQYINGEMELDEPALEGAISGIVTDFANEQTTMAAAGQFHFISSVVREVDNDYNTRMLKAVREVTRGQIKSVMKDVLLPAFIPGQANVVATCATIMTEGLTKGFSKLGFKTQTQTLAHFEDDYGLTAFDGEDEEEGEEDEDVEMTGESASGSDESEDE
ncbi:zinc metalloprotease-like protein [Calycina marina]|uniref:Zinc metalloprotease-like protein n=1 Tax=Calycina marina TaxID=1763456 RepID=A0A9P8CFQ0_9HELO|nr:zinc metalloprotease-like protein [Calycina marina]